MKEILVLQMRMWSSHKETGEYLSLRLAYAELEILGSGVDVVTAMNSVAKITEIKPIFGLPPGKDDTLKRYVTHLGNEFYAKLFDLRCTVVSSGHEILHVLNVRFG